MSIDPLTIAVRAWTEPSITNRRNLSARARRKRMEDRWPRSALTFDTETTTDAAQRLMFGSYRYSRWDETGECMCFEEGLFYSDDLAARDPDGLLCLEAYARDHPADLAPHYKPKLKLYSRREFLRCVFWPAVLDAGALVTGFNLVFDLPRLASDWGEARGRYRGGFSLVLAEYFDRATQTWKENRYYPRVCYTPHDSKRAFIGLQGGRQGKHGRHARFLDLRTLTFALTNESHSLASACEAIGVAHSKAVVKEHGRITAAYIDYNRCDVLATQELLEGLRAEFDRHPIALDPCKAYSPASVAKKYLEAMGLKPPRQRFRTVRPWLHGAAMQAYYGGRAECRIRKTSVPIVYTDFVSMYPTVNALLRLWDILTAERLDVVDCTDDARALVDRVSLDAYFDPSSWQMLGFFAQVRPNRDTLPVRGRYSGASAALNIGVNQFTADSPLWYAGPDLVAATLLSGRPPEIVRAVRLVPHGKASGLTAVRLRGEVPIAPERDDFFRAAIEERQRVKRAGLDSSESRESLASFLKVIANAGSYGIFAEQNRKELRKDQRATVRVFGLGSPFECRTDAPEEPGPFTFPPLASLITSGARLMLALLERSVTDAGGAYAFCDTDSMAIVATELGGLVPCAGGTQRLLDGRAAILSLSWPEVRRIVDRFAQLNPYDRDAVPGSILKIEAENFVHDAQRQLHTYVISAKRYAVYTLDAGGEPAIVKYSEHGLGHLRNPTDPDSEDRDWIRQLWMLIVRQALGLSVSEPAWLARPAISRHTITQPRQLAAFQQALGRDRTSRLMPGGFLLAAHVAPLGHPPGVDPTRFQLFAPFEPDARRWLRMPWVNAYTGESYRIAVGLSGPETARVTSYRDVLDAYRFHPEPKSAGPDGTASDRQTVGLLQRRHVRAVDVLCVGKESNNLEAVEAGLVHDPAEVMSVFDAGARASDEEVVRALTAIPRKEAAMLLGVTERTVARLRNGHQRATRRVRAMIRGGIFDAHHVKAKATKS